MRGWTMKAQGHNVSHWKCWKSYLFDTQGFLRLYDYRSDDNKAINLFINVLFQAISSNGTAASMSPGNCSENQTPYLFAILHNGTEIGAKVTMTANGNALFIFKSLWSFPSKRISVKQ
ncbi:hypothetical protein CHS0354_025215 [Potamilus streckersoni]|uniref:Uncharacterized protein n=1 Tax=Potamilus streckersoni TaxID=2493646 RepID=A0AAE0RN61_9BIVA|nr:hypothetical protein CHS0354_025215 [Potamilus streckersoni]